jgi:DNA topoisomerase-1
VVAKAGRFGPYVQSGETTSSLFNSMSLETITLDDALKLLSLPRTLGQHPGDKEPITAQNGRYGPYVKHGSESRSLAAEEDLFTVTLEQALALLAQPKTRGRRAAAAAPLREMGANDPVSGQPMVIKDGRFGPYVTDGETNASLRKGDEVAELTPQRAAELLADRRARGPAKKTTRKKAAPAKSPAKKTAAKEPAAKKTAAKKTTKKTAAKKAPAKAAAKD